MGISKIVLDGSTICDISSDTVDKSNLAKGARAIGNSGDALNGEARFAGSEYAIFDSSTSSRLSGSDATFYLCKTDGLITINTKARMSAPKVELASPTQLNNSFGFIPSTWDVPNPTSASMTSFDTGTSPLYIAEKQLCYQCLNTTLVSTIASAWSLVTPNYTEASIPPISSTWTLNSGYSGNACVDTSKSSLTIVKMDNIAYLHGTIYLSSDQTSGDWVTLMTVPDDLKPPADFGVPVLFRYKWRDISGSSSRFRRLDGALTKSGELQLKSVQHKTLLFGTVSQQGTKAGMPLDYDLVYPLDFGTRVK